MRIFLYEMKEGHRQWVNTLRTESADQMAVKKGRIQMTATYQAGQNLEPYFSIPLPSLAAELLLGQV